MKKHILLFIALFTLITSHAQEWHGINGQNPSTYKTTLISSTENKIVVEVSLNGFYTKTVQTPVGEAVIICGNEMASLSEEGSPDIPILAIPTIIGDLAEMNVKVIESQFVDFKDVSVVPSKGDIPRTINPEDIPYIYGNMYGKDIYYPDNQAKLELPYILRDFRAQNIMVCPFAYNDAQKTLRVYHHLLIEMNKVSDNGINQKISRKSNSFSVDPEIKSAYKNRFINFGQTKYNFIEDEGSILVICKDSYLVDMEEFVTWKNNSGRPTFIVGTEETGTSADEVKAYIESYYESNPDLTHILLVGDFADITPKYIANGNYSGYSDNYFGMLEGDDYYIEAFVGRFSAESSEDVVNQVKKVLYYERDMPETVTWLNKGIGIGANNGSGHFGESDSEHIDFIRDTLMHYSYESVSQRYSGIGSGTNAGEMSADFNEGVGICNFSQHGSPTGWSVGNFSNSHVAALTNDYKWPFIWSTACDNGQFDYYGGPCFAEMWMRAVNSSTGAPIGAIGGMFSYIAQPWIPPMTGQDNMVKILTEWESESYKHTLGGASLNGNMHILDLHPDASGKGTHNSWILFGDPSLMVRTDNPTTMNVSCQPSSLTISSNELTISADVNYGIATLNINGEVIGSAKIENGISTIHFDELQEVGAAELIVIGYNKVTYIGTINITQPEGLEENIAEKIKIYPNPSEGIIFISSDKVTDFNYAVYNIQGQAVMYGDKHIRGDVANIDMNQLKKGVYFIEFQGNSNVIREKVIIK